jgi:hypothetical protein
MSIFWCLSLAKESVLVQGSVIWFVTDYRLYGGVASPLPIPQAGGQPLFGCPSYPTYRGAISISILRTCHAVVTGDPLHMDIKV